MKLLLAEDEAALRHALTVLLQRNCYTVDAVDNGADALAYLRLGDYDGAVLDVMMPKMDGLTVLRRLRAEKNRTPILLLTARSEIEDRVMGLDAGANDYLVKPFDIRELLARIRVLTRSEKQENTDIRFGNVCLDTASFTLSGPKDTVELGNKEYQCLLLLLRDPGKVIPAEQFMEKIWDPDSVGQENTLWTVIYNLRKKLEKVGADLQIGNKRNLGYLVERI